jgi:cysteine desulfurase
MIYLDYNATTPCAPEVIEAMRPFWAIDFGNPSSSHKAGFAAKKAVENGRKQISELANCSPSELFFTSGATESNNLIFLGLLLSNKTVRDEIIISSIEHKSVSEPAKFLSERGFNLIKLPVSKDGVVDLEKAEKLITNNTALVSVQAANNEIGTIQPIAEIASLAHRAGSLFHTDAAQVLGKISVDLQLWDCDFASFSAHKLYGPKGIGALYVKGGIRYWPWEYPLNGGGQEKGLRPGTLNVPGIVGFGEACRLALCDLPTRFEKLQSFTEITINKFISNFPDCIIHALKAKRIPGTISISIPGIPADVLLSNNPEYCISIGSACNDGSIGYSDILRQLTDDDDILSSTFRVSLGIMTESNGIEGLINRIFKLKNKINNIER